MGLLKIFQQNLHIYHRNDSTSLCTIRFIYILVLEDVIGSDVGGRFLLAHPVYPRSCSQLNANRCSYLTDCNFLTRMLLLTVT